MDEIITNTINKYCDENLTQIILSNSKCPQEIKKVLIRPIRLKGDLFFQSCEYRGNQVFHENHTRQALLSKLPDWLGDCFKQAQIWARAGQATILVSKKGKVTVREKKNPLSCAEESAPARQAAAAGQDSALKPGQAEQSQTENNRSCSNQTGQDQTGNCFRTLDLPEHNRKKNYILAEGKPVPFLLDLGVMTPEGRVVHARYDKFRQINRFLEFIEDILPELPKDRELSIIDFGCGKSYLTFAMYYYLHELKHYPLRIMGLDLKTEVIEHCNALADRYGYGGLHFLQGDIASYEGAEAVDMVVTLHACDTATDAALKKAVDWGARVILSVPCCQHELNRTIKNEVLAPVLRYGLIKERMAALITDGLRADLLEQLGYKVQVLEFIDMEHTPKNILLRAVKKNQIPVPAAKRAKREAYERCIRELGVAPALYRDFFGN
ncbi:MAG: SAM-dependent methyltransferase [Lachnospiraceae bacterium]|nr:SAM-dependent methyltransferase [Lachnospiraceae bacterium]